MKKKEERTVEIRIPDTAVGWQWIFIYRNEIEMNNSVQLDNLCKAKGEMVMHSLRQDIRERYNK